MRRENRPDGIVSSAGAATLAIVAGIEDAGLTVGRDVDIVSKQSSKLLHLFRPAIHVVNEDFRWAGHELARCGAGMDRRRRSRARLQSLSVPTAGGVLRGGRERQAPGVATGLAASRFSLVRR